MRACPRYERGCGWGERARLVWIPCAIAPGVAVRAVRNRHSAIWCGVVVYPGRAGRWGRARVIVGVERMPDSSRGGLVEEAVDGVESVPHRLRYWIHCRRHGREACV